MDATFDLSIVSSTRDSSSAAMAASIATTAASSIAAPATSSVAATWTPTPSAIEGR